MLSFKTDYKTSPFKMDHKTSSFIPDHKISPFKIYSSQKFGSSQKNRDLYLESLTKVTKNTGYIIVKHRT